MDNNGISVNKKKMRKVLYVYIALVLVLILSSRTIYNFTLPRVTVAMPQSGSLFKELEARGVIGFSETFDIYAASGGQIEEMLIKKGDLVDENTVIAIFRAEETTVEADFAFERIENHLSGLALNRADIQERLRALNASPTVDFYNEQWAVTDAIATVEKRQAELSEAQRFMVLPFNKLYPIQATTDFEREWNRKVAELKEAEAVLLSAETGDITFDDFIYQRNINEAAITLERRNTDLKDAEDALAAVRRDHSSSFDNSTHQNAINAARTAHERSIEDYNEALRQYDLAVQQYYFLLSIGADSAEIGLAQNSVDSAQSVITNFKRVMDDANNAASQAADDMRRAENTFNANRNETRQQAITAAETQVSQAERAAEDAGRAYENAVNELERAKDSFNLGTEETKEKALNDAQKRVEAALSAIDEMQWNAQQKLLEAETHLANAQAALERLEINLNTAQSAVTVQTDEARRALDLELSRTDLNIASANIDLRELEASRASDSNGGNIRAYEQGIVISVEKSKGQFVAQGEKIATVGVNNHVFTTEVTVSDTDGRFIALGDEANIHRYGSNTAIKAVVYDIVPTGDTLSIFLVCETDVFNGGEYITVRFYKQTETYHVIVPNEAIYKEAMGSYIWVLHSRQGVLGIEYFTARVRVFIADSDDFNSAISRGLEYIAPVVISHDKDLAVNERVSRME